MPIASKTNTTVQVYRVYIKASPQAIWDAITKPEWTQRYGYRGVGEYDLRPGGVYRSIATKEMQDLGMPEVVVDGEIVEADPPHKLVTTWRALWLEEGFTRVTWEIEEGDGGVTTLTVTHDDLDGKPNTAAQASGSVEGAGGGWAFVLSDLKTLLETGTSM
jgi:uncharacterized protein YndB with AHSA1/START domain